MAIAETPIQVTTRGSPKLNPDGVSVAGCSIIYAPAGQAGEYAPLATNPYRGCGHKCAYCLDPNTLILMADGSSKELRNVEIGDSLIGVVPRESNSPSWTHTYAASKVLNKIETSKVVETITLDNGMKVRCSSNHRWLTEKGWQYTKDLTTQNHIRVIGELFKHQLHTLEYQQGYIAGVVQGDGTLNRYDYSGKYTRVGRAEPQKTDVIHQFRLAMKDTQALDRAQTFLSEMGIETTRFMFKHLEGQLPAIRTNVKQSCESIAELCQPKSGIDWYKGWLAGFFDAEGSTSAGVIRFYNTDSVLLEITEEALKLMSFDFVYEPKRPNGCFSIRVLGGLSEIVRFFNLTTPAISRKFPIEGVAMRGSSRVVSIERGEEIPMLDITTSTENFIANGMVSHNCYVPLITKQDRVEFNAGSVVRTSYMEKLKADAKKYKALGVTEQVMLSFTTDPYPPAHHETTREALKVLREAGLGFCTLTKGGTRALRDLDLFRSDRDAFATTMTSTDPVFSKKWESGAADPDDRMKALKTFHDAGIFTWVSLEPTLNAQSSLEIVKRTHEFVDHFKVGRVNYLGLTQTTNWEDYTHKMMELMKSLGQSHYFKKDLQKYLPEGYYNPLRVQQYWE